MKKVLLSLLAVAALVLSCQNYDDEFDALNAKVSSLESQISSLQGLQTALTSVQSSVSALQSAVNAIPDPSSSIAALATSIAEILTDLGALETAVAAATTSADLDALKATLNTSLEALKALIEANSTSIASLVASNASLKSQLEALGVDVDAILAGNAAFEGDLSITNAAELAYAKSLGGKVATIKGDVTIVVDETKTDGAGTGTGLTAAQVNTVTSLMTYVVGNVKLTTDASLDLSNLTSITGDYVVLGHDVSDDSLTSVGDDVYFNYDGAYTSKIETADNIFLVIKDDALASATAGTAARTGTTSIDFLALTKASGVQSIAANSTHTSGGSLSLGPNAGTQTIAVNENATSVKIGQAPVIAVTSGVTAATTALTAVELHYAADLGTAASGLNPNGVAKLASLTLTGVEISTAVVKAKQITGAVTINVQASTATSNSASIDLSSAVSIGGLLNSNANSNSISVLKTVGGISFSEQATFSAPELTTSVGNISLTEATTFSAPKLARVSAAIATGSTEQATAAYDITADKVTGSVSLPALTKAGDVSMDLVTTFSAPLAKVELIDIEEATTLVTTEIELGSLSTYGTLAVGAMSDAGTVDVVKLHNQDITFDLTTLVEASAITYKGKANAAGVAVVDADIDTNNEKLVTLTLGGVLNTVSVDTDEAIATTVTATAGSNADTALATVITSGTIVDLTVQNNFDLTTLTLGHTDDVKSTTAPVIVVKNNNKLASFSTSVKKISELTVTGNKKLGSFNFSSISELPNNWTASGYVVKIDISGNETDPTARAATYGGASIASSAATADALSAWYGLTGTYTASSSSTSEAYGQSSIATLKTFFSVLDAKYFPATGTAPTMAAASYIKLQYRYDSTGTAATAATTLITLGSTSAGDGVAATDFDDYAKF